MRAEGEDERKQRAEDPPDHAGVAFHPPLLLAACLVVGFLARGLAPLTFLPKEVATRLGPVLTAVAFALFFWAVASMRRGGGSIPTREPTEAIVVRGPYRFSRNPIYLSMILLHLATSVWANSLWFVGLAAVNAGLLGWGVISREERYLERKFGSEYSDYRARVRRWI